MLYHTHLWCLSLAYSSIKSLCCLTRKCIRPVEQIPSPFRVGSNKARLVLSPISFPQYSLGTTILEKAGIIGEWEITADLVIFKYMNYWWLRRFGNFKIEFLADLFLVNYSNYSMYTMVNISITDGRSQKLLSQTMCDYPTRLRLR